MYAWDSADAKFIFQPPAEMTEFANDGSFQSTNRVAFTSLAIHISKQRHNLEINFIEKPLDFGMTLQRFLAK